MTERTELHKRNRHNGQYDFKHLICSYPMLEKFVAPNKYGDLSINFFDPQAVKALNKALLISYYNIKFWDIPANYLCPPIPGRANYIHYIAELIDTDKQNIRCLDIGVGANCIYPIIGHSEYGWNFVGTDIDPISIENAQKIINNNHTLSNSIEVRLQGDAKSIFNGVVLADDYFDITMCNPPFHRSKEDAERGTMRKLTNLKGKKATTASLNFGGQSNELWCDGGELRFLLDMITQSKQYSKQCGWFTSLVSNEDNLSHLYAQLKRVGAIQNQTIQMTQGNKTSRILAWKY